MKKIISVLGLSLLILSMLSAQNVPQGINYQAMARDAKGLVLADQAITLKISLLADKPEGKLLYSEIHDVTTSPLGLFNIVIGEGLAGIGEFDQIPWGNSEVWMDIALAQDQNDEFVSLATTRLLTVPYAFHAATAGVLVGDDNPTEKLAGPYWKTNGNDGVNSLYQFLGTVDANDLVFKTNYMERMRLLAGGDLWMSKNSIKNMKDPVDMQDAATKNYVDVVLLTIKNLINAHVSADGDMSPTNELITGTSFNGALLRITEAGTTHVIDLSSLDESAEVTIALAKASQAVSDAATALATANAHVIADGDLSANNELQTISKSGNLVTLSKGGGTFTDAVNDADADPTNEIELPVGGTNGQVLVTDGSGHYSWVDREPTYTIGLHPELGGYVFYVTPNGKHGLVAATQDQGVATYYEAQNKVSDPASHNTSGKNFKDWRIPTKYELNLMFLSKTQIGGFLNDYYWSVTPQNDSFQWFQNFNGGSQLGIAKTFNINIRAIRAF